MTIAFFLKPHYRQRKGWDPVRLPQRKRKRAVYEIEKEGKEIIAKPVDMRQFAISLVEERRKAQRKRIRRQNEALLLLHMMDDD